MIFSEGNERGRRSLNLPSTKNSSTRQVGERRHSWLTRPQSEMKRDVNVNNVCDSKYVTYTERVFSSTGGEGWTCEVRLNV